MFEIGQRVVCISNDLGDDEREALRLGLSLHPGPFPQVGSVYTVGNTFAVEGGSPDEEVPMVELVELPSPQSELWHAGFEAKDFRPLTDKELSAERKAVVSKHFGYHLKQPQPSQV